MTSWQRRCSVSEPEEVITEAAHFATVKARELWRRRQAPHDRLHLADVRRRLDLLVAAIFPGAPTIGVAEPLAPLPLLARFASPLSSRARPTAPLACTDGTRLRLPASCEKQPRDRALRWYQLLALEQAARSVRGTAAALPGDPLVRDLFLLAEGLAVDGALATLLPGLRSDLAAERTAALCARPAGRMTARETAVETLLAAVLGGDPTASVSGVPHCDTTADSLAWAIATAGRIRVLPGRYRGIPPVPLWGTVAPPADAPSGELVSPNDRPAYGPRRTHTMPRRPRVREQAEDEDDPHVGTWIVRADDPQESVEDPMGLQRPADHDDAADPADLGDSLSDLREARLVRTPDAPREVLASIDPVTHTPANVARPGGRVAFVYPEWDHRAASYHRAGAVVREWPVPLGDREWVRRVLERSAPLVHRVRRDFERLRPRREFVGRQGDGSAIDVDAYVTTAADARAGASPDDRLYVADQRSRRDAAVFLLVDASASTDSWIAGTKRVIDVEREGLLIVAEALAALGDAHAIFAFRGEGAGRVDLLALKRFGDSPGAAVRERIASLEPDGYTRVGAAVRHATALLARAPARMRLLLLLSDGRPNDVDVYEGRYGVEDTRRSLIEARRQGVHTFCMTVDRDAPSYAARLFGRSGYSVVSHPERLPVALVRVLRRLLRA